MKQFMVTLLIGAVLASCSFEKDTFTINGSITGIDSGMIFLQKYDNDLSDWIRLDSAALDKGNFTFNGKVTMPEMWHLSMPGNQVFLPVFVEPGDLNVRIIADSMDLSEVTGSVAHDLYLSYLKQIDSLDKIQTALYKEYKSAKENEDEAGMKKADSLSTVLDNEIKKQLLAFVKKNNTSVASPYIIMKNSWQFELPELEEVVVVFDTSMNNSVYMQLLKKRVEILRSVAIGQAAPDFTMNDSTGAPVTLSQLNGKYLLVDFWASWCSPCRVENPNVVRAWKAFHSKGFDIMGVSFDKNRDKWVEAIQHDNLAWTHVSDLKGWGNAAGKLYGINSIPSNVLLNPDQKIIARNLRGEDLMKKLEEIFGPVAPAKKTVAKK